MGEPLTSTLCRLNKWRTCFIVSELSWFSCRICCGYIHSLVSVSGCFQSTQSRINILDLFCIWITVYWSYRNVCFHVPCVHWITVLRGRPAMQILYTVIFGANCTREFCRYWSSAVHHSSKSVCAYIKTPNVQKCALIFSKQHVGYPVATLGWCRGQSGSKRKPPSSVCN